TLPERVRPIRSGPGSRWLDTRVARVIADPNVARCRIVQQRQHRREVLLTSWYDLRSRRSEATIGRRSGGPELRADRSRSLSVPDEIDRASRATIQIPVIRATG